MPGYKVITAGGVKTGLVSPDSSAINFSVIKRRRCRLQRANVSASPAFKIFQSECQKLRVIIVV